MSCIWKVFQRYWTIWAPQRTGGLKAYHSRYRWHQFETHNSDIALRNSNSAVSLEMYWKRNVSQMERGVHPKQVLGQSKESQTQKLNVYNKNAENDKRWNDKWKNVVFALSTINWSMRGVKLDKVQTSHLTLLESPLKNNLVWSNQSSNVTTFSLGWRSKMVNPKWRPYLSNAHDQQSWWILAL